MPNWFHVQIQDQNSPLIRDALGRFVSAQNQVVAANRNAAEQIQNLVVEKINERIIRKGVSTGRLLRVTAAAQNRGPFKAGDYKTGFGVGEIDYLNSSQAKYWRTVEEGSLESWSHPFAGMQFIGLWGATVTGIGSDRLNGSRALAGPPFSRNSPRRSDKLAPYSILKNYRGARGRALRGQKITIKHEIAPQHAYEDAFNDFNMGAFARRSISQILNSLKQYPS